MSKPERHSVGVNTSIAVNIKLEERIDTCGTDIQGVLDSFERMLASGMHVTKSVRQPSLWIEGIEIDTLSTIYLPDSIYKSLQGNLTEIVKLRFVHARGIEGAKLVK